MFLNAGADIGAKAKYKGTALARTATNGHEKVLKFLLSKGADVYKGIRLYCYALYAAALYRKKIVV